MEKITRFRSRTVVLPQSDIDTDQILPARFLTTTTRAGMGDALFADWRYDEHGRLIGDFPLNRPEAEGCQVLVAGNNFGCGSSREHAPWGLVDYGFKAVISTAFADIFRNNSLKNGLIPIIVDQPTHQWLLDHPGVEVEVDLEQRQLRLPGRSPESLPESLPETEMIEFPIDNFSRYCLMEGIDQLGYLLKHSDAISRFEQHRA